MYSQELQNDIVRIYEGYPMVREIINKIKEIDDICEMELDTLNEREHMKAVAVKEIIDKSFYG